jgi:2-polyprenyl-6-methoxyphenol hydroxylase-like FAD-dependent oxidoreductase
MNTILGRRAVVIGAGIGGLSAAGALAGHFEHVDILERDLLPAGASSRPGTPQDRHPHGLLVGGLQALKELFPGVDDDLAEAGAIPIRFTQDVEYERPDVGTLPHRDLGLTVLCASRPLIEFVLRRRVEAIANVTLRPACRVIEILTGTDHERVRGVHFDRASQQAASLEADLVVDASGRGMPTLQLLDALSLPRPQVAEIRVDLSYATVVVQIPPDALPTRKLVLTQPDPPAQTLHSVLVPIEGDRWMVLIADRGAQAGVRSWDDFLRMARRLTTQTVYHMLSRAKPPSGIRHYGFPASRWQHFERLARLPPGLLPVADALCRFNPIHGQGMSVAAKEAHALQLVLGRVATEADPIAALQAGFMVCAASIVPTPWNLSTSADLAFPTTRGERPEDFAEGRQFESALFRAAAVDPVVQRTMTEVAQLMRPFSYLQQPELQERIRAASIRRAA